MPYPWRLTLVSATALLLTTATLAPSQADHTPAPDTVTLVGSLQSELGCPGDWQPECAATHLQPVAGSPGVFRGTFDVPAGDFELKAAINDSFDENYGAGGQPGGANIPLSAPGGPITFTYDHATHVISDDLPPVLAGDQSAQWVRRGLLAWDLPDGQDGFTYRLHASPSAALSIGEDGGVVGGRSFPLHVDPDGLPQRVLDDFPQLGSYDALRLPRDAVAQVRRLLRGQLVVASYDADGTLVAQTGVQLPGVLDDVYASAARRPLGVTWRDGRPTFAVWAPTAQRVDLEVQRPGGRTTTVRMHRQRDGAMTFTGPRSWAGATYLYAVRVYAPTVREVVTNEVTDPYSVALTTDSERSVVVDLDSPRLAPRGWRHLAKPPLARAEDSSIYELHVRDFSASDETVPAAHRGTYLAFTDRRSDGMRHLRGLARAGLTTVHLLPVNDIATIEERRDLQQTPDCDLASFPPDGEQQQECVSAVAGAGRLQLGLRPAALHDPGGLLRDRPGRARAHPGVPRDGRGPQPRRAARGDGRRLQPHPGSRAGPALGARPGRAGLLPAAQRDRPGRDDARAAPTPRPSTP